MFFFNSGLIFIASLVSLFAIRAQVDTPVNLETVIEKYQQLLSDWPTINPIAPAVTCDDDKASWRRYSRKMAETDNYLPR